MPFCQLCNLIRIFTFKFLCGEACSLSVNNMQGSNGATLLSRETLANKRESWSSL